jgi:NADH-quinone oxidoreductase subunit C
VRELLEDIVARYGIEDIEERSERERRVRCSADRVPELAQECAKAGYITLEAICCSDRIEDGYFELSYILTDEFRREDLLLICRIGRDGEGMRTLSDIWVQAEVMERDLHEMYGIPFDGNGRLEPFALENWTHTPPLRREFDTLAFVQERFEFRGGREENIDVKAEAKRLRELKKREKEMAKAKESDAEAKENG